MERLTLALIAHDSNKDHMICLLNAHRGELAGLNLVVTRGTGQAQSRVGLPVTLVQSGPHGGDQQIGDPGSQW